LGGERVVGVYQRGQKWWISFTVDGRQVREPAGHSRKLAERVLEQRRAEVVLGRFNVRTRRVMLREYSAEYLEWAQAKKKTWKRDRASLDHLTVHLGSVLLSDLRPARIEAYQQTRLHKGERGARAPKPATVNREVACLKKLLSLACRDGVIAENPAKGASLLPENNERNRIATPEELAALTTVGPSWLRSMITVAYHSAMRQGELRTLTWDRVDLKAGFVRLRSSDTKTGDQRSVPLKPEAAEELRRLPRPLQGGWVFKKGGKPLKQQEVTAAFNRACRGAKIEDLRFHDLRHTAITNWRRAGHDYFRIMAASGHKTMAVFKRYNTVDDEELRQLALPGYHNSITIGPQPADECSDRSAVPS